MFKELNSLCYKAGGVVRDYLLNRENQDTDYVISCSLERFREVFPDTIQIGKSFPVFLIDGNEVALTRTERCIGNNYTDYEITGIGVSLEDDARRRDITINSLYMNYETGDILDPTGCGLDDIRNKVLRATSVNSFSDDPLRILRVARFYATLDGFTIDGHTKLLMKKFAHKLADINPERIYAELCKVYEQSKYPSLFFTCLEEIGALKYHFKPLYLLSKISAGPIKYHLGFTALTHSLNAFDKAKRYGYSFDIAIAALLHDTGKGISKKAEEGKDQHHIGHEIKSYIINKQFIKQHRFTTKQNNLIVSAGRYHMYFHILDKIKNPLKLIKFYRNVKRNFDELCMVADCDHEITDAQLNIISILKETFSSTTICIPKTVKGEDNITQYVNNCYVQRYKELLRKSI